MRPHRSAPTAPAGASRCTAFCAALAALALLAGCASAPAPGWQDQLASAGWELDKEVSSVSRGRIGGFQALDRHHLIVHTEDSGAVLVTVGPGCGNLSHSSALGHHAWGGMLSRHDRMFVPNSAVPGQCVVEALNLLKKKPAAAAG